MSIICSDLISSFLIPKLFKQETAAQFKSLSKEIVKNTKILLPKDYQSYQKICSELKKICDANGLKKITKWEQVVSTTTQLRQNISQFKPSEENSSDEFNSLSQQMVESFEYLQSEDLANFQNICDTFDSDQNKTVATWQRLVKGQGLGVNLYSNELILPPASFKKSSFLHPLLKEAISKNKLILQASDEAIDVSKKHLVEQALLNPAELIITNENVWDVLKIADFYQINKLKKAVCEFGKTMLLDDLFDILFYSKKFNLDDLYNFHFPSLKQLDKETLAPLLNDLLEIATQNQDQELATFLFFHVLRNSGLKSEVLIDQKDPSVAKQLAFLQQSVSLITSLNKLDMNWSLFKIALPFLKFNLKEIDLSFTSITDDELRELLENSSNLQKINLYCRHIIGTAFNSETIKLEHLIEINMSFCSNLTDDHLKKLIEKCPKLQKINLSNTKITGKAFASGDIKLEHLTEIDISDCANLTDDKLKMLLEKCPNLQIIKLSNITITGAAFDSAVIKLEDLKEIDISECKNLTDDNLQRLIQKCPNLQKINLSKTKITGVAFDSGAINLEHLTEIDISYCYNFKGDHLKMLLEKNPHLQKINLEATGITCTVFESEAIQLEQLTEINISGIQNFTAEDLKRLSEKCPNLQKINLASRNITGAAFDSDIKLEQVTEICLANCTNLTDEDLKRLIEKCPNLQKINLSNTKITGKAFASGNIKLEQLTEIYSPSCKNLTDDNLKILLEKCPNLQKIELSYTNITGTAFDSEVIELKHITKFEMWGCLNFTNDNQWKLIKKCSHLKEILMRYSQNR
jgi:uncharacterized protein YjbI with pentapeptide repeats